MHLRANPVNPPTVNPGAPFAATGRFSQSKSITPFQAPSTFRYPLAFIGVLENLENRYIKSVCSAFFAVMTEWRI